MDVPPQQLTYSRVAVYIDGFNLYHGMKDAGLRRHYWLDVRQLGLRLLLAQQKLTAVNYFTSRISQPQAKRKRQSDYLEAMQAHAGIVPVEGHFLSKSVSCFGCGRQWPDHEEKMTDVNIATQLMTDAYRDRYDTAVLVSGDSDLVPPIRAIREFHPARRVVVAFPPKRYSRDLVNAAHGHRFIDDTTLGQSQLPDEVTKPDGYVLRRPAKWN